MSVIPFPDRTERIKAEVAARWRRALVMAGVKVPEAEMLHALDILVPSVCEYLTAEARLKQAMG